MYVYICTKLHIHIIHTVYELWLGNETARIIHIWICVYILFLYICMTYVICLLIYIQIDIYLYEETYVNLCIMYSVYELWSRCKTARIIHIWICVYILFLYICITYVCSLLIYIQIDIYLLFVYMKKPMLIYISYIQSMNCGRDAKPLESFTRSATFMKKMPTVMYLTSGYVYICICVFVNICIYSYVYIFE
jgi:hypothetical protein